MLLTHKLKPSPKLNCIDSIDLSQLQKHVCLKEAEDQQLYTKDKTLKTYSTVCDHIHIYIISWQLCFIAPFQLINSPLVKTGVLAPPHCGKETAHFTPAEKN